LEKIEEVLISRELPFGSRIGVWQELIPPEEWKKSGFSESLKLLEASFEPIETVFIRPL